LIPDPELEAVASRLARMAIEKHSWARGAETQLHTVTYDPTTDTVQVSLTLSYPVDLLRVFLERNP